MVNENEIKKEHIRINHPVSEKLIPKLCSHINLALVNNKNIVLTMAYGDQPGELSLIERVAIDIKHAESLHSVLAKLLEDSRNVPSN